MGELDPRIVVGSRWGIYTLKEILGVRECPHSGSPHVHWEGGGWDMMSTLTSDPDYQYVSPPSPPKGSGAVDWARWLPPRELPDTGPKDFEVGQVWASRIESGENAMVCRFVGDDGECEYLARGGYFAEREESRRCFRESAFAKHAILVQDVNETSPRSPESLYGAHAETGGGLRGEEWATSPDDEWHDAAGLNWACTGRQCQSAPKDRVATMIHKSCNRLCADCWRRRKPKESVPEKACGCPGPESEPCIWDCPTLQRRAVREAPKLALNPCQGARLTCSLEALPGNHLCKGHLEMEREHRSNYAPVDFVDCLPDVGEFGTARPR